MKIWPIPADPRLPFLLQRSEGCWGSGGELPKFPQAEIDPKSNRIVAVTKITRRKRGSLVDRINHVMSSMQMLALNASIEASKVGVHGRGFAVVAEHMTKSVENVRKLTEDIGKINGNIRLVSNQIDQAISRLEY
jgi:hypothetical protein